MSKQDIHVTNVNEQLSEEVSFVAVTPNEFVNVTREERHTRAVLPFQLLLCSHPGVLN